MNQNLCDRVRLDSIMCVMDAAQIFAAPEMMELKLRQIAFADMLILNKADLVSRDEIARIRAWLDEHFHRYRLVEATRGEVPLEILLSAGRFDAAQLETPTHDHDGHACPEGHCPDDYHDHTDSFSTWSYQTDEPLSLETLRELARKLPASIYRCKGVINSSEEPHRRTVLQVVGKRVDLTLENELGDRKPLSRIVAIGARDTLDADVLRKTFEKCLVISPVRP